MATHKLCFVIPVYNHHPFVENLLERISCYGFEVFLIDDGSMQECRDLLKILANAQDDLHLIRLPYNQGKGAAVMAGMREAYKKGFTHALQIDADGQHNIDDIPSFVSRSQAHPNELISGQPSYDDSVPKARKYGRHFTHVWVWIETLSLDIKDSMCGFRVYPLDVTIRLIDEIKIKERMDFDTDILVRLYWRDVAMHFIKTKVVYPIDGISHFDSLRDNIRITKMHTYLFFGMLKRLPKLLQRKFRGKHERD